MMLKFEFEPFDVLFFGSGKAFNRGDDASSIFPPFSHTFAGAISKKLATFLNIESSFSQYRIFKSNKIYIWSFCEKTYRNIQ